MSAEVQSVPCPDCGWPSLSYQCFTECRDSQGRVKKNVLTDADIDYAFMVDAYEKQRTAAYRAVLRDQLMLLDAQVALRNGRLDVVAEFLERATNSLLSVRNGLRHAPKVKVKS